MKALVYEGPGRKSLMERPMPVIAAATDAIVRVTRTTICGTDLHILKGDVPTCTPGRILGHEGVGIVEETGAGVTQFTRGDRVLISCISSCGKCEYCRRGMYSHCTTGGWILGNTIDGTQAEYVRIPHADTSLYPIPEGADEEALVMLSDILPTGFECGVLNGKVQPGGSVAIVGAGPIGLAALLTAQFYSPAEIVMVDLDENRLSVATRFGATKTISAGGKDVARQVLALTGGKGADTVIEAVGIPATFELCQEIVAPGGIIANIGVHGVKADLHLERLWSQNIAITTRLVDTVTIPMLLKTVRAGKIDPKKLITHRFALDRIADAYETFSNAANTQALKVIIETDAAGTLSAKTVEETGTPAAADVWSCDLATRTGLVLHVRPVRPEDEAPLADFFTHVAPEDLRFRFLGGVREVSHERLVAMTRVDHRTTENFLAFAGEGRTMVATAMVAFDPSMEKAEVAISVRREDKHKGVAWEMLRHVARYAQARGAAYLESVESRENHEAIELEREQGFVAVPYDEDPTLVLIRKDLRRP
ncbi:threonine dehydrogenase-like Zn-dependent dehydrogenase/GNAT superfamily N-acetyltransferase [Shinella fusca]|uniref:Threonine dehydrogenase-like Zn-dependent dehydrogenase/GNAT superfamily N-acetyltransferase n=2 Tax=Shinella fusca TaxID=544480 RepID=A0A7W7YSC4_9HYPH|nr:threonine dehydrogenase-like Zn-dependent dehydrogenase/GNAT superfamily N-acetyltransferase [Shinella fusca]